MTTITLTLTVTEDERARLVERFIQTAQAVTGEVEDDGVRADPNGSKVGSDGVVWDARYHGVNMTKNQDGTWRRKKNMTAAEKADADAYEAGCRGAPTAVAQAAAGVPAAAPTPQAPAADIPAFLQTGSFAPQPVMPVPGMPAMPAAMPAMPAAPVIVPAPTYAELIAAFSATVERLGVEYVQNNLDTIYRAAGVEDVKQLETNEELRRLVKAGLEALK